ncbi:hypothetical protein [Pseudodesulfovibrio pelocollis]|uniref:hypothetical protein n=1 Tax=Pseudodesulfovibrio pelocollis TaxID=3051432 RepID=UPI00255B1D1A|nr:hypothetical protein [Pseudodesulfovibrio sp. SB368]
MIDVSDVLDDPDFRVEFIVTRSVETVNAQGMTVLTGTDLPMSGVILPATDRQLNRLPEADRSSEVVAVYTSQPLTPGTPTLAPDVVHWRGGQFQVVQVQDWLQTGGVCIALAAATDMRGREINT